MPLVPLLNHFSEVLLTLTQGFILRRDLLCIYPTSYWCLLLYWLLGGVLGSAAHTCSLCPKPPSQGGFSRKYAPGFTWHKGNWVVWFPSDSQAQLEWKTGDWKIKLPLLFSFIRLCLAADIETWESQEYSTEATEYSRWKRPPDFPATGEWLGESSPREKSCLPHKASIHSVSQLVMQPILSIFCVAGTALDSEDKRQEW